MFHQLVTIMFNVQRIKQTMPGRISTLNQLYLNLTRQQRMWVITKDRVWIISSTRMILKFLIYHLKIQVSPLVPLHTDKFMVCQTVRRWLSTIDRIALLPRSPSVPRCGSAATIILQQEQLVLTKQHLFGKLQLFTNEQ